MASKLVTRLSASAGALGLALVAGEVALRVLPVHGEGPRPVLETRDEHGAWVPVTNGPSPYVHRTAAEVEATGIAYAFRPDVELRYVYPSRGWPKSVAGKSVIATTNDVGRRGPDVPRSKPAGTWRVAAAGDSITFGHGVPDGAPYVAVLAERLNERLAGSPWRYDAVNGGVSGYDVLDCEAYLRHELLPYEPDLVVYGFYLNDVLSGRSVLELPELREAARDYAERFGQSGDGSPWDASRIVRLVRSERMRRAYLSVVTSLYEAAFRPDSEHWRECADSILRMQRDVEASGASFVLVVLPMLFAYARTPALEAVHERIRAWGEANGVAVVDAGRVLGSRSLPELQVHPDDVHYNVLAHALVADAIEAWIVERGLFPGAAESSR